MKDIDENEELAAEAPEPEVAKPAKKVKTPKKKAKKPAERIKELESELAESEEKTLRLRAEYDNYRKRSYRELTDARAYAKTDTLTPILNVFDHFQMAVAAVDTTEDMSVITEGLKMIGAEFVKAMDDLGVVAVDAVGEKFDPNLHEAVAEEASDQEEGIVIKQWRCGYKLGDKL
ncbi:MAG: nucleotide exchange factor GrpE, partial [Victivallales bacterium]|nr:nucleotide exchange factor GrpE [Victivallales bacterium]